MYAYDALSKIGERIPSDRGYAFAVSPIASGDRDRGLSVVPSPYPRNNSCPTLSKVFKPHLLSRRYLRPLHMRNKKTSRASLSQRGFSLLETVVALGLSSLILLGSIATFTNTVAGVRTATDANVSALATFKTHAVISTVLFSLERNRLPISPLITPGARLTIPNGEKHPLATLTGTSAPRIDSDIISVIEISPIYRARIRSFTRSGTRFTADACGMYETPGKDDFKSVVVLAVDGAFQATGEISRTLSGCIHFEGTVIAGLISTAHGAVGTPLELAAITREHSLFVDRSGEFRLASHVGTRITENQPLTRGLRSIRMSAISDDDQVPTYSVVVRPSYGGQRKRFFIPGLARRSLLGEVLQ